MKPPDEQNRYWMLTGHPSYLTRIETAERYATRLLPYIPRGLPVYQSHGIAHSSAILGYINQILTTPGLDVSPRERSLLYMAAWFHDIGYLHPLSIHNRGTHPELSVDMIRKDPVISDLVPGDDREDLLTIIRYHDSQADLRSLCETVPEIRTPLLAALFRLADAVDIGNDRCPAEVFSLIEDGLDEHSRRHWMAHQNVRACVITYPVIRILVHDPENPFFRRRIIPHLEDDCRSTGVILKEYGFIPFTLACRKSE